MEGNKEAYPVVEFQLEKILRAKDKKEYPGR